MKKPTVIAAGIVALFALSFSDNAYAQSRTVVINSRDGVPEVYVDDFRYPPRHKERKPIPHERWAVRVGIGMPSDINTDYFTYDSEYFNYTANSLSKYYGPYTGPLYSTGSLSVGGEYLIARWFAIGADLATDMLYCKMYDSLTGRNTDTHHGVSLSFTPMLRFYYLNRPKVRLYGSFGLGVVAYFGYNLTDGTQVKGNTIYYSGDFVELSGQYIPIGVEFGRRVYGFAEAGVGTIYSGIRAGAGIKL